MTTCMSCEQTAASSRPVREEIYLSANWRVAHAFDTDLPGWLVVVPTFHALAFTDLTAEAAAELGTLIHSLSHALTSVTGCEKTYVMQFAEAVGFAHLHVHVVPRMPDQDPAHKGPGIFARLGRPVGERLSTDEMDEISTRLKAALTEA